VKGREPAAPCFARLPRVRELTHVNGHHWRRSFGPAGWARVRRRRSSAISQHIRPSRVIARPRSGVASVWSARRTVDDPTWGCGWRSSSWTPGVGPSCNRSTGCRFRLQVEARDHPVTRTPGSSRPTAVPSAEPAMAVLEINGEHVERSPLDRLTNTWPPRGDLSYTVALFWRVRRPAFRACLTGWSST
jgi:hypothetical protein